MEAEPLLPSTRWSYDQAAGTYADRHLTSIPDDVAISRQVLRDHLAPGGLVADLGCGPGRDLAWFEQQGLRAVGVDVSSAMLVRVRSVAGGVCAQADQARLPFLDGSLDGIWCASALLHVPRRAVPETLGEFRRALRPGGVLTLITPIGADEGWELLPYRAEAQPYDMPLRRWFAYHQPRELRAGLARAGFELIQERIVHRHRDWWHGLAIAA